MEIRFLGTGGAFHVEQGNSAVLLTVNDFTFLVDCGHSVFPRLVKSGWVEKIDAVLISHLHDDHVGSLSSLVLYWQHVLQRERIKLIYPTDSFRQLLTSFLAFSLGNPDERIAFTPIGDYPQVTAIDTFGQHVKNMATWGFCFREGDAALAYSGDLGNPAAFFTALDAMNLPGRPRVFHELSFQESYAHTWYRELLPYRERYDILGYHHDHRQNPPENPIPLVAHHPEFLL
ncbi:MAG: MBL fold metallo-hydrolase [Bacteroidota bacterium]